MFRPQDGRFLISGYIDHAPCRILLDSGASVTVVRHDVVDTSSLRKSDMRPLRAANDTLLDIMGRKKVLVGVGNSKVLLNAFVVKNLSSPCILGCDGLRKLKIILNFGETPSVSCNTERIVGALETVVDCGEAKGAEKTQLMELLAEYKDLFDPVIPGAAKEVVHRIVTEEHEPFVCRGRRIPLTDQQLIEDHVEKMLRDNVISPSESPYRSPIVMADRKDGEKRFCVNYCKLNALTKKNRFPLPRIDDLLDRTRGSKYFCILDMSAAYWQVPLAEEDREKTAFSTSSGHYHFNVMPFGLCNAPATQQESMKRTFKGLEKVDVLLDDVIVHGVSISELLIRLRQVFILMRKKNLKLKMKKCKFMQTSVLYLGWIISGRGKSVDPEKTRVIDQYPIPTNVVELRTFLGMSSFMRKFVNHYAHLAKPLYELTKKNVVWNWTDECQMSFEGIKRELVNPPILACPDVDLPYQLYTDASGNGMGATLCQFIDGKERVIAYGSQVFNAREKKYSVIEKEAAAVVWAINHFRPYLKGARFRISSDHAPLKWLATRIDATGRLGRWQVTLLENEGLEGVEYLKGENNTIADGLSRMPEILLMTSENEKLSVEELKEIQEKDSMFEKLRSMMNLQDGVWKKQGVVFVPQVLCRRILSSYHGEGIHFGVQKTLDVMKPVVFWPGMDTDVRRFIQECEICKSGKSTSFQKAPNQTFDPPKAPFQRIAMDFAGPYERTKDGNKYFIVIVDHFSRYLKVFPVREATMEKAIGALQKVIYEEGTPEEVLTDRGTHFTGEKFEAFLRQNNIKHLKTTAYHPQCDGLAERQIRTLKDLVRCSILGKIDGTSKSWDTELNEVCRRMNQTIHRSTGFTPFSLARGRTGKFAEIDWLPVSIPSRQINSDWDAVRQQIMAAMEKNRGERRKLRMFEVGEKVFKRVPSPKPFEPRYTGPYLIIRRTGPVNYEIGRNDKTEVVHVDRLI